MKIAFVILAHKYPEQIVRLVQALSTEADRFFIHIDRRAAAVFQGAQRLFQAEAQVCLVEERQACYWGQFSIVKATLNCLQAVCQSAEQISEPYDYVFLISGQDYPIKPLSEIKRFLAQHRGRQFIEAFPLLEPNRWTEQSGPYQASRRIMDWHFFLRSRHLHLPLRRQMPNALIPYGGSQWWALTGECVQYLIAYIQTYPSVINYFKYTFIPDELFFQTLVCNSPFKATVSGYGLSYVDWTNPNPTPPRVLTAEDYESLQQTDCLFARKFDPQRSQELLALVDRMLLPVG